MEISTTPAAAKRPDWLLLILVATLSLYVAADLTPSSYGGVLRIIGADPHWTSLGEPRAIRSDEWAIWTPSRLTTILRSWTLVLMALTGAIVIGLYFKFRPA